MAAIGDSYTAGSFSGAPCAADQAPCLVNSWSTGTANGLDSHLQRLLPLNPQIAGAASNHAISGRKMADLPRQAQLAVDARAEYVTIMLGLNDVCRGTEAAMTDVATFRAGLETGMTTLTKGLPNAHVLVTSIIDPERLRTLFASQPLARQAWNAQAVCSVFLADADSTAAADVQRRQRARARLVEFNDQLAQVCAAHANCRYDGGVMFNWQPTAADIITRDYLHPSATGQARIAALTWAAGFDFVAAPPPPPPAGDYAAAVLADGPVSYWRLNETSGTNAANAVTGPPGRYTGTFSLGAPGAIAGDQAVTLGANGYVAVTHAAALNTADNFTLEAWIKRNTINSSAGLFAKGTKSYQVYIDATNKLILRQTGIGEITRSTTTLTDKTSFHHIAVTKNAATVRLYIDGVDSTGTVTNRTLINTTADLILGAASGYLNGTLDEVAIYNHALTATTIANHHAVGTDPPA